MDDITDDFIRIAHSIVWCTVATVDRRGRPRSRVLHPIWEHAPADGLVGWVGTQATSIKRAHLDHSPYVSCSYWQPNHDFAIAECAATWVTDRTERRATWDRFANGPAPVGYDPGAMPVWADGPDSDDWAVLRLEPWRIRLRAGEAMLRGEPVRILDRCA